MIDKPNRRTVLKGIGAGVAGSAVYPGLAGAHGTEDTGDFRLPSWFETQLWELTARPPFGEEPTDDDSHAPIWHIAPDAKGQGRTQVPGILDFSRFEDGTTFATGEWGMAEDANGDPIPGTGPCFDHTLSAFPFSTLWHVHWVFEGSASKPYAPTDLANTGVGGVPLTNGSRIRAADDAGLVDVVSIADVFNCPIRPNKGDHYLPISCSN